MKTKCWILSSPEAVAEGVDVTVVVEPVREIVTVAVVWKVVVDKALEDVAAVVQAATSRHITNTVTKVKTNLIVLFFIFQLLPTDFFTVYYKHAHT